MLKQANQTSELQNQLRVLLTLSSAVQHLSQCKPPNASYIIIILQHTVRFLLWPRSAQIYNTNRWVASSRNLISALGGKTI